MTLRRTGLPLVLFVLCSLAAVPPSFGQTESATLSGLITDPQGKVVTDVEVEVTNVDTNVTVHQTTNGAGLYVVVGLKPGRYRVSIVKDGFRRIDLVDLVLNVQDVLSRNFQLQLGPVSSSITVTADAANVNTTDATVGTVIDRQFVENIPLNGRSFQSLILLTPGVTVVSGASLNFLGEFSVNGQRTETNYYMVDGVSANTGTGGVGIAVGSGVTPAESALGTTQSMVSVDALQEFRINTSTYAAEYGRTPGGQISFQTRSGTNTWHGSLFDYFRNDALDANNWFNNNAGLPKTAERQNDFGGTLGGPIEVPGLYHGRDKTFFFFSYEGLRLRVPQPAVTTTVPDAFLRQNAPTALQPLLNAFPIANGIDNPDHSAEFTAAYSSPSNLDAYSIRVDHTVGEKLTIFGRYADTPSNSTTRAGNVSFAANLAQLSALNSNVKLITIGATAALSPRFTNEFRFNYTRNNSSVRTTLDNFGGATPATISQLIPGVTLSPTSQFDGILGIGTFPGIELYFFNTPQHQWNITDSFTSTIGAHTLKYGIDYRRLTSVNGINALWDLMEFLSPGQILANSSGFAEAMSNGLPKTGIFTNVSAFAEDEWRLSGRLHLSLGLRWDLNPLPRIGNGPQPYTLNQITDLGTAQLAPAGTPLWHTDYYGFAPRIGLAYQLRQSTGQETVIRGGFGVFYDLGNWQALDDVDAGIGFASTVIYPGASFPFTPMQNMLPPPSTASPYNGTVYAPNPNLKLPYTLEWNFAVQQGLGRDQTLTLSYVAASGRKLLSSQFYNPPSNPNFVLGNGVFITDNGSSSNYNSLQVQFQRRLSHGVQALAAYTWSHSIDNLSNTENSFNPPLRGNSDFDLRHNVSGGLTYEVPGGDKDRFLASLLTHWGVDLRQTARSGLPVDIQGSLGILPNGQNIYTRPDVVPGVPVYLAGQSAPGGRVVNFNAFTAAAGPIGDEPRNFVRGFAAWQTDLAIRREFPVHERLKLQLRMESFNVLNNANLNNPNMSLSSSLFGKSYDIYPQDYGRRLQLGLKVRF